MKSSSKVSDVNSTLSTKSATSMNNNDLVKKSEDEKPEEEEREQFGNTLEFFFSVLGYAGKLIINFNIKLKRTRLIFNLHDNFKWALEMSGGFHILHTEMEAVYF